VLGGVRGGGGSRWEIQFRQYARDVAVDGVFAEGESVSDVVVAHPARHQAEDLYLASAEAGSRGGMVAEGGPVGAVVVAPPARHQAEDLYLASAEAGSFVGMLATLGFYLAQQCRGVATATFCATALAADGAGPRRP